MRAARGEAVSGAADPLVHAQRPEGDHGACGAHPAMLGHPGTVLVAFDDITALKEAQAQLEESVRVRQDSCRSPATSSRRR